MDTLYGIEVEQDPIVCIRESIIHNGYVSGSSNKFYHYTPTRHQDAAQIGLYGRQITKYHLGFIRCEVRTLLALFECVGRGIIRIVFWNDAGARVAATIVDSLELPDTTFVFRRGDGEEELYGDDISYDICN